MGASKAIRQVIIERGTTVPRVAFPLGLTANNLSMKLLRDNFKYSDVTAIADALACDVVIIDDATGKPTHGDMPEALAIDGLRYNDLEAFARYLGCSVHLRTRDAGKLF